MTRRYPPLIGGAERVLSYLAEALAREGAEVTVLTSRTAGTEELAAREEVPVAGARGGGRLTILRLATSRLRFVGTWLYMRNLRKWFAENAIDLAYVSMLKHDAYVAVGAGLKHGFPVVLRPEGAGATGDLAWQGWGNFGRKIGERCRQADAFVTISKEIARELVSAGYDPARIHDLPNGVPVPEHPWQRRADWRSAPRAVFVGRLAPEKGLGALIDAWPLVRQTHPQARLILIGEGPERPLLEQRRDRSAWASGRTRRSIFPAPGRRDLTAPRRGPVRAALAGGGHEHRPARGHGPGHPPGRLVDPGQSPAGQRLQARPAGDAGRSPVPGSGHRGTMGEFDRAFHMSRAARSRVQQEFSIAAVARKHLELFRMLRNRRARRVLKILQLIPTLDRSGAEKQMVLLAKGLPRDRFRVEVAALTRLGPLQAELEAAGIPVTSIGKRFKVDPFALSRLVRFLKAGRFDVVQTWIFAANTYGRVAARMAGVPVIVTTEMAVDLWKGKAEHVVDRRLARWCDRLVGNSHAVVDYYRKLGVPDDRLAMIYSGITEEQPPAVDPAAVRAEFGFAADAPVVLFAGRLAEQKRIDDLLKALDLLQHVQPDLRTLIAGDGPLRTSLEQTAHAYHLDGPRAVPRAPGGRAQAHGRRRPRRPAQRLRGSAEPGARGHEVRQAGGRNRGAGDDGTRCRRAVRRPGPHRKPPVAGPGDPRRRARSRARPPPRRGRPARVDGAFRSETMIEQFATLFEQLARAKGLMLDHFSVGGRGRHNSHR